MNDLLLKDLLKKAEIMDRYGFYRDADCVVSEISRRLAQVGTPDTALDSFYTSLKVLIQDIYNNYLPGNNMDQQKNAVLYFLREVSDQIQDLSVKGKQEAQQSILQGAGNVPSAMSAANSGRNVSAASWWNVQSPTQIKLNLYQILGLPDNTDIDTVHRVYPQLAQRYNPSNGFGEDPAAFDNIQHAYSVLGDNVKKSYYDASPKWRRLTSPQPIEAPSGAPAKIKLPVTPSIPEIPEKPLGIEIPKIKLPEHTESWMDRLKFPKLNGKGGLLLGGALALLGGKYLYDRGQQPQLAPNGLLIEDRTSGPVSPNLGPIGPNSEAPNPMAQPIKPGATKEDINSRLHALQNSIPMSFTGVAAPYASGVSSLINQAIQMMSMPTNAGQYSNAGLIHENQSELAQRYLSYGLKNGYRPMAQHLFSNQSPGFAKQVLSQWNSLQLQNLAKPPLA